MGLPVTVLEPRSGSGWEDNVNRPSVVHQNGQWHMWYSGQVYEPSSVGSTDVGMDMFDELAGKSVIGYATSDDGLSWARSDRPVLEGERTWKGGR